MEQKLRFNYFTAINKVIQQLTVYKIGYYEWTRKITDAIQEGFNHAVEL